jgi:hypothetical protein
MSLTTRTTLLICSMAPAFGLLLETSACGPSEHDGTAHCDNEIHRALKARYTSGALEGVSITYSWTGGYGWATSRPRSTARASRS